MVTYCLNRTEQNRLIVHQWLIVVCLEPFSCLLESICAWPSWSHPCLEICWEYTQILPFCVTMIGISMQKQYIRIKFFLPVKYANSPINLKHAQSLFYYHRGLWDSGELWWRPTNMLRISRPRWTNQRYSCSAVSVMAEWNRWKWRQQWWHLRVNRHWRWG